MFILDSSAIIEILNGTNIGKNLANELKDGIVSTTVFSLYEILLGAKPKETAKINDFFESMSILNFENSAAKESSNIERDLAKKGELINKVDIFIASICKLNDRTLITGDKDFKKVPNLKIKLIDI
ncbi:MAG TPA: type II toxin-antitoxin system VapC family toxin [Candidatus Nanoarchaeia archaeon]|nr:type II toxin-antitoxin system VapC family toxin [Candidatus Nanoarchaeia archaeon]